MTVSTQTIDSALSRKQKTLDTCQGRGQRAEGIRKEKGGRHRLPSSSK
jgi:hypothetical protein